MTRTLILIVATLGLVYVSRKSLCQPRAHGFYRFFAWEAILLLMVLNSQQLLHLPLSTQQVASWVCFSISMYLVCHSVCLLTLIGKPSRQRTDDALFSFERTSTLVTSGTFKYIRHPIYTSLLFLTAAAFLQQPAWSGVLLAGIATGFIVITALHDEAECKQHFGLEYSAYMQHTTRFIPFLF